MLEACSVQGAGLCFRTQWGKVLYMLPVLHCIVVTHQLHPAYMLC
jgi:hypothetical protein